jgi:simple sugar transport system substrate-binding protein
MSGDLESLGTSVNRRRFIGVGVGFGAAALAIGACDSGDDSDAGSGGGSGEERELVLAFGFTLPFATPIAVGAKDACDRAGWRFTKLFAPTSEFTEVGQVEIVQKAINSRPDVMLTGNWTKGDAGAIKDAVEEGIEVVIINAYNFDDVLGDLGLAYVGPDEHESGLALAAKLGELMGEAGVAQDGVVIAGNSAPGSATTETRIRGIKEGLAAWNDENDTAYSVVSFDDRSGASPAESTNLYSAQISRLGDKLAGFGVVGGSSSLPPLLKACQSHNVSTDKQPIGSWDNDEVIVKALSQGEISFFMDQGNYYQGFYGGLDSWAQLERDAPPLSLATEAGAVDKAGLANWKKFNEVIVSEAKAI